LHAEQSFPHRIIDIHNHLHDDPEGDRMIEIMDSFGTEAALILGTYADSNETVLRAMRKHEGRFAGGAFVDPRKGRQAIDSVRHYSGEGFKFIKLFPNFGYYPDDDTYRPFFDAIAECGMGVLSHCGWLAPSSGVTAAYYSHPGRFEKVIRAYKDTIFIMAHMGGIAGFLESVMLTTRTPNTYVDCSPGQGLWVLEKCGAIAASVPAERLMWGADMYYDRNLIERYCKAIVALGLSDQIDRIFYVNGRDLLAGIGAIA
jgi:predicted TIM-barrel fold metal-dependent hydrolase